MFLGGGFGRWLPMYKKGSVSSLRPTQKTAGVLPLLRLFTLIFRLYVGVCDKIGTIVSGTKTSF